MSDRRVPTRDGGGTGDLDSLPTTVSYIHLGPVYLTHRCVI